MLTPESVMAERQDAKVTGEAYCELAVTGATVAWVSPMGRRDVAAFLRGLLSRSPVVKSPAYEAHRAILGALMSELETFALLDADEVVEPADLRDAPTVARERAAVQSFREWVDRERPERAAAYHGYVDGMLVPSEVQHAISEDRLNAAVARAAR